jgi:hypothetical protein
MELKPPEERSLVLVRGNRSASMDQCALPRALSGLFTTTTARSLFATELRLTLVGRALRWRLRPADVLYAVAFVLGRLAATAVRGDRERLDLLVEEVCRQVRDAAEQAFGVWEAP